VYRGINRKIKQNFYEKITLQFSLNITQKISDAGTVYKIDTIDVDGKPEVQFKCLKIMVGERGFEPPTPWSRTRFRRLLNSIEFCRPQVIDVEGIAATA
jgi:hypothetical protein